MRMDRFLQGVEKMSREPGQNAEPQRAERNTRKVWPHGSQGNSVSKRKVWSTASNAAKIIKSASILAAAGHFWFGGIQGS